MRFTDFFIRRATTTTLLIAAIAGFGLLSYFSLPVSNLPEVEYPTIRVQAALPGANPDVMASTVATPLESEFSTIPGIEHMTSTSQVGETNITLQFDLNRGIDAAAQDVQAAISRAAGALPASMPSPPSYSKVNPAQSPDPLARNVFNDDGARRLCKIRQPGLRQARLYGERRLPGRGLRTGSARDSRAGRPCTDSPLTDSISNRFAQRSPATAPTCRRAHCMATTKTSRCRPTASSPRPDEFSQMIVAYRDGSPIRLNQVANVFNSSRNDRSRFWINGRRSVILAVRKQPGANTVEVADKVKAVILSLHDPCRPAFPSARSPTMPTWSANPSPRSTALWSSRSVW